jgi:hypothetical protein
MDESSYYWETSTSGAVDQEPLVLFRAPRSGGGPEVAIGDPDAPGGLLSRVAEDSCNFYWLTRTPSGFQVVSRSK